MRRTLLLPALLLVLAACTPSEAPPGPVAGSAPAPAPTPVPEPRVAATPQPAGREPGGALLHPEKATETAPATYKAKFATTKGDFVVAVTRAWAPNGADRFYNLVKLGFYDGVRFYRAVDGFMVQFGVNGDPAVNAPWSRATIADDPVVKSNLRGFMTFAMAGVDSRTTQVFINYADDNRRLDGMGFAPFAQVVDGMKVVDALFKGYGEIAPRGKGPNPSRLSREGERYLQQEFPDLDQIKTATLL
jgi:peptidyl-prolyl cis-trans isomerase A (cyclophilin A)